MKQNITLSLEKDLLQEARILAVKKATSVSRLLSDELTNIVKKSQQYERARKKALADLKKGYHLGGKPASREELHGR